MFASPGAIAFQIPALFGFGPFPVRWYGILMATSIVVGLWLAHRQAKREGLPADDIISVGQWSILAGIIGARLYEVIFNWDYYGQHLSKIPAVWEGGLAMHGGLIVGPLVGVLLAWKWGVPILKGLDVIAPAMVLGQAIGRWGNFFNEEAFGRPTCPGSSTSRPRTGRRASASSSTSTRRSSTSRSGTQRCSWRSSRGCVRRCGSTRARSSPVTAS